MTVILLICPGKSSSFSTCYLSLVFLIIDLFTVVDLVAAVTPGLLTIVRTGITIVSYFGNVTSLLCSL